MRDRSGRSDFCKRFAFTRCSRHVFAQASLCKPRQQGKAESGFIPVCAFLRVFSLSQCNAEHCRANTQRGRRLRLIGFAPAGAGGRTAVLARQTESHTPYRSFLRQSVPHGTRSPAAQIVRCGVLRGSFLHKRSSDALAASFSFFFFPQRKRTRASPFWKRKTLTKKRTHPRPFFLYFVPKRRSPASPSPGRM